MLNYYRKLDYIKEKVLKKLYNKRGFRLRKYKRLAENNEKFCNRNCTFLGILTGLSYLIFHPIIGKGYKLPWYYFVEKFGVFTHVLLFIAVLPVIYAQVFPIYYSFYITWSCKIQSIILKEYIETNLCTEYEDFDIIQLDYEQEKIYTHLKKCTEFHLLLKR